MPSVRKLTPEEVQAQQRAGKGQRKLVEEEYDAILRDYELGDYGVAELGPDEKRLTVRNRLKAAALRRGIGLEFRRTRGYQLRFQVVENVPAAPAKAERAPAKKRAPAAVAASVAIAAPASEPPAAPVKKKPGRPRKPTAPTA